MLKNATLITGLSVMLILSGCSDSSRISELEKRLKDLETTMKSTEQKIDEQESKIDDLEIDKWLRDMNGTAHLRPSNDGYSIIKTSLGAVTVMLTDVKAYANGSRVTLKFGNPTGATLDDVAAKVTWGRVNEKGHVDSKSQKSRKVSFEKSLQAGSWTSTSITLEGIPPAQLGFVRVSDLEHGGIVLSRR